MTVLGNLPSRPRRLHHGVEVKRIPSIGWGVYGWDTLGRRSLYWVLQTADDADQFATEFVEDVAPHHEERGEPVPTLKLSSDGGAA